MDNYTNQENNVSNVNGQQPMQNMGTSMNGQQPVQNMGTPLYGQSPVQNSGSFSYNQMSGNNMGMQGYQQPQKEEKYGLGVASLVVGILSMTLCCVGGSVVGLIGLILGIISCTKKESKRGLAIGGIITSAIGFVIGVVYLCLIIWAANDDYDYDYDDISNIITEDYDYDVDIFDGNSYQAGDGSVIYFEDGEFIWYQDDSDHDNNIIYGTYDAYTGEDASDHIVYGLSDYGVTDEELDDYFAMNADSDYYTEENFYCLVLHNEAVMIDGENQVDGPFDTPYMGFYVDGYFDAANMRTAEYVYFSIVE